MSRDEIQKLLGGYATGTLTAAEQEALFAAALDDQELFDALAREQSLRDLLRDPAAKAHLLSALDEKPKSRWAPWWRPAAIGLSMAALTVVVVRQIPPPPRPEALAVVEPKSAPAAPAIDQPVAPRVRPVESEPASRILEDKAKVVAGDKEIAPASERVQEKKVAANEVRREADQLEATRDQRAAAPAVAQPVATAPAPPAPTAAPGKAEEAESKDAAVPKRADAYQGGRRQSARALFLFRPSALQTVTSSYVEAAGQQGQIKQQSPAPPAQQSQQGQQQAGAGDSKLGAPPPQQPGVRYTVAGGTIRLETNDYGHLDVLARGGPGIWRTVLSSGVQPGQVLSTTPLRPDEKEVAVSFSRTVELMKSGPTPPQPGEVPATNLVERDGDSTYVVNPLAGAAGRQVTFTIRLP